MIESMKRNRRRGRVCGEFPYNCESTRMRRIINVSVKLASCLKRSEAKFHQRLLFLNSEFRDRTWEERKHVIPFSEFRRERGSKCKLLKERKRKEKERERKVSSEAQRLLRTLASIRARFLHNGELFTTGIDRRRYYASYDKREQFRESCIGCNSNVGRGRIRKMSRSTIQFVRGS